MTVGSFLVCQLNTDIRRKKVNTIWIVAFWVIMPCSTLDVTNILEEYTTSIFRIGIYIAL
jgi:hypothetical protein